MSSKLLKEKIKARMMQNAAHLWGAADTDIEVGFDPLISILMEGCINEIEKIGNDIENVQARVLNQMVQMLTPDNLTGYLPSHAIIHARANEATCFVRPETQFYFTKKVQTDNGPGIENNKEIFFSPVSDFKLVDGAIKYFVFHDGIYDAVSPYQKNLIAESEDNNQLDRNVLWLGVELNSLNEEDNELSFFFDLKNNPSKHNFLYLLPFSKWSINAVPLKIKIRLDPILSNTDHFLDDEFDADKRFASEILSFYNSQFVRVVDCLTTELDAFQNNLNYPDLFEPVFAKKDLQKISTKCSWIKIEFPNLVTEQMLADLICCMNCFPVVNKKLNEFTFRLAQNLNIVPLHTNEYFFSVKQIQSTDGKAYASNALNTRTATDAGTYTLRQGGIERFDSRKATEMISYLLDLLRDESGAFTMLGNEFISSHLRELNQLIALLEQRTGSLGDTKQSTYFLLVYPRREGENIFVSFWSTNGESANNIKAGNKLEIYGSGDIRSNSVTLMTSSKGGRGKLDEREKLNAFRSSLISRNRIVTGNDIRMFCFHELGKEIDDVKIRKGFMVSPSPKGGFVQTIEVRLQVAKNNQTTRDEWTEISDSISKKLMDRSVGFTPFNVMAEPGKI